MIYLDHAATTPVAREVADTMYDVLLNGSGNPSSQYPYGAAAKKRLEADRAVIAAALGCKPDELYFTSCGTESDNWAIRLAAHQNRRVGKHIITTAVEHSAVLEPCRQLEQEGYTVTYLAPDPEVIICSMKKEVGSSIYDAVKSYLAGDSRFGTTWTADMATGYVGIGYGDSGMAQQVPDEVKAAVEELAAKIASGEIVVETTRA